jgi:hypothetical protein
MAHKHEVRITVGADSWSTVMVHLRRLIMDLPPQGAERHIRGSDSSGGAYVVDVDLNVAPHLCSFCDEQIEGYAGLLIPGDDSRRRYCSVRCITNASEADGLARAARHLR